MQWIRDEARADIYVRDTPDGRRMPVCVYCGRAVRVGTPPSDSAAGLLAATLDHVWPHAPKRDRNKPGWLATACFECNNRKGDRDPEQWEADEDTWDRERAYAERHGLWFDGPARYLGWRGKGAAPSESLAERVAIAVARPICKTPRCRAQAAALDERRVENAYHARVVARERRRRDGAYA